MNKIITDNVPYVFLAAFVVWLFNRICQIGQGKPRVREVLNRENHSDFVTEKGKISFENSDLDIPAVTENKMISQSTKEVTDLISGMIDEKEIKLILGKIIFMHRLKDRNFDNESIFMGIPSDITNQIINIMFQLILRDMIFVTIKSTAEVTNLISAIDAKEDTALRIKKMIFPFITPSNGECIYTEVQNLLNICNKLLLLKVLVIEKSKRGLTIKDIPSLMTLSIGRLDYANFLKLEFLENLTKISIKFSSTQLIIDGTKLPQLKRLIIGDIERTKVKIISPDSLKEIQINFITATQVSIIGGSKSLEVLVLGDKCIEEYKSGDKMSITITGVYSKLRLFEIRSLSYGCVDSNANFMNCGKFIFQDESLNFKNFPLLGYCGKFIDRSAGPDADPKAELLARQVKVREIVGRRKSILAIIMMMFRFKDGSIEEESIFSVMPSDITRQIINFMLLSIILDVDQEIDAKFGKSNLNNG